MGHWHLTQPDGVLFSALADDWDYMDKGGLVVVEIPDPRWGEVGVAFVALTAGSEVTPEELRRECRARLANYKVPKQVVILDEVPRLEVGKVDRNGLRERARERFAPGATPQA